MYAIVTAFGHITFNRNQLRELKPKIDSVSGLDGKPTCKWRPVLHDLGVARHKEVNDYV